ncbi:DUF932 domain-containing protein [Planctomycetes bacterium TBK1r]|uniref:DUF932 domain-containing protein n=1 Tax=Stieleria magnilauensis TaxID=2527963 RepID=A0ABX5XNY7_9BACT|nr:hypothetical protein TBK1r_26490 [Planctomycetes bacterium TBK1r]
MATLKKAHDELFRRTPDEAYQSFDEMYEHCSKQRLQSEDIWERPQDLTLTHDMTVCAGDGDELYLNDWSFSQMCRMAGVSKETVNRLSHRTASKVFKETLPRADKPLQVLTTGTDIRSIHGVAYTRLWNADLLDVVKEFASDFTPPQTAMDDTSTGLYCGEQDLFAFMIDPTGWAEIDGQAFAPGFFVWNSEVGKRSLGIQTFWFQKVCQNHIVWDATEVVDFSRKHTANVRDGLDEIRSILERLVARRDERRDSFATVMKKAMTERLGDDADEVTKVLSAEKIPRGLIKDAMEIARTQGGFTIFALVDALTKLSQKVNYAGDRTELDSRIGQLLALAA